MSAYIVAITGASGSLYAQSFLKALKNNGDKIYLTISEPGFQVLQEELGWHIEGNETEVENQLKKILDYSEGDPAFKYFDNQRIGSLIASGSVKTKGMIIIPCTMSTLAGIANGSSKNLIERAADVMLKERRPLIVVPRETPFNQIHLKNMLTLAQMGVHIIPAMPAFYQQPKSIQDLVDFIVGRVLAVLGIEHRLFPQWKG